MRSFDSIRITTQKFDANQNVLWFLFFDEKSAKKLVTLSPYAASVIVDSLLIHNSRDTLPLKAYV